jgi:hypothetical protein
MRSLFINITKKQYLTERVKPSVALPQAATFHRFFLLHSSGEDRFELRKGRILENSPLMTFAVSTASVVSSLTKPLFSTSTA